MSTAAIPIKQTTTANISIANGSTGINYGWSNLASTAYTDVQSKLRVHGDAEFDGDIAFKGRSLDETLKKIEERLGILIPNVRLEEDWKELKDLRMQYVELEKQLLEKQRVFDILKKQ